MKKLRIRKINVLSAGKVVGIIYLILGIFLGLFLTIVPTMGPIMVRDPSMIRTGYDLIYDLIFGPMMLSGAAIILVPILYGIGGFLAGVISAFLYNLIANWIGPIEIETD